jgi:outer membrane autotransporter protein
MMAPAVARQSTLFAIGTFHDRTGGQTVVDQTEADPPSAENDPPDNVPPPAVWGRVFGEKLRQDWGGALNPRFDGQIGAIQAGFDILRFHVLPDGSDHVGVFYTYESAGGDAHAFVLGQPDDVDGTLAVNTNSIAAYWTHVGEGDWYAEAVLMGSFYAAHPNSSDDIGTSLSGHSVTGSLEGGYPIPITDTIAFEPQLQLIVQSLAFDPAADPFTTLLFDDNIGVTGRIGLQLDDEVQFEGMTVKPRLIANFWRTFSGNDTVLFDQAVALSTPFDQTVFEIGGGGEARLTEQLGGYADFTYSTNLGGQSLRAIRGLVGLRYSW